MQQDVTTTKQTQFSARATHWLLVILVIYWVVVNYVTLHAPMRFFDVKSVQALTSSQVLASNAERPEQLETDDWHPQILPDDWYHTERSQQQYWYRLHTTLDPDDADVWAVYLPSVTHNAAVYINGIWVGQGGGFDEPVSRHHNNPLLFSFSSSLLKQGDNGITIRVKASHPRQGLLDQVYVAPKQQLIGAYKFKHFVRVDFIKWISFGMYFMGVIVMLFWLARPQDKIYGIFSAQLFIWATHNLNLFVFDIPTSAHFWEAMTMSTLGWTVILMIYFNHRFVGQGNRFIEKLALSLGILGLGIYFLPDIGSILSIGYGVWDAFLIFFGCYAIIHLIRVFWLKRELDIYLMVVAGIPILVFGLHDILTVNHIVDRRDGLIIQYSVIPAIFLFSWFLIRRFVQSINNAEQLAATLESRVIEKQQQIAQQYQQLGQLEQQKMLAEERERIMRDMHDGIGGQLVSVIASLQEQQGSVFQRLKQQVQQSLTDLRFVIDSLDPVLNDIPTLLGMMRPRLAEQLDAADITLQWQVEELPELSSISPQRSLHIMRIVQEVMTNVIKHSQAKAVTVKTFTAANNSEVIIEVSDDGIGFNETEQQGRGLENMRYRARQINAQLDVDSSNGGTNIRLVIPVVVS